MKEEGTEKVKVLMEKTLRDTIHPEYRHVVERRVFTVMGARADEETIERLIETGDGEQIFQKAIQEQIMDTLVEIQERHDAVRDLERKLLDLQQEPKRKKNELKSAISLKISTKQLLGEPNEALGGGPSSSDWRMTRQFTDCA
ncbi:hypothetical protein TB2_035107 [Malus domestica]